MWCEWWSRERREAHQEALLKAIEYRTQQRVAESRVNDTKRRWKLRRQKNGRKQRRGSGLFGCHREDVRLERPQFTPVHPSSVARHLSRDQKLGNELVWVFEQMDQAPASN